jgi:hypothetical protein
MFSDVMFLTGLEIKHIYSTALPPSPSHETLRCPNHLFGGCVCSGVQKVECGSNPQFAMTYMQHVVSHAFVGLDGPGNVTERAV